MNAITPFDFEGRAVRVVEDDAGLPWFVALDVCECLGIVWKGAGNSGSLGALDEDEKGVVTTDTLGGQQQVAAITEPGVYKLCFRSRKPEAKRFVRWLTHDVLPALRRTGTYSLDGAEPADPPPPAMPLAPQHRADVLVSASRIFGAALRTARQMRVPPGEAMRAAYMCARRHTGVDWQEELGADLLPALAGPASEGELRRGAAMQAADEFRAAWLDGSLGLPDLPVLSNDAFAAFTDWCARTGRQRVPQYAFVAALTGVGGMLKSRHRYRIPGEPRQRDVYTFLIPLRQQHPPPGQTMENWLGECIEAWRGAAHLGNGARC
ncbi:MULTISPECIES: BRO-N domain-containing protein [Xanthomonas]|uniref:Bro-N domain-containing protein n=1 Tax=Xanthomonas citri pv. vignicola TaxID=473426 RepID=A0AB33CGM3_XANCI|nr:MULTISPECIES: BRO family protein [Xanthomonas]ASK91861.1 hypothetical protein XcvCFBP7111P_10390 [Xanthomonas citri pv. vignicola]MBV6780944.1 hypothetical protein [Xanthomonas campestris pv. trichodesmae]MBV6788468.1 hypothetical protein [Xanthomonas campestris pv. clerodendri]